LDQDHEPEQRRQKLLAQAMKLLARREHSRAELAAKLAKRGYQQTETDAVLDECEAQNWLDDQRYAELYIRQRKEALYGPLRILAELQQRGIHGEPEGLSATPEMEWRANAAQLREKKFGLAGDLDWNERGRQGRFLTQRGFTMGQIEYALERRSLPD
jgi:regulatory protein